MSKFIGYLAGVSSYGNVFAAGVCYSVGDMTGLGLSLLISALCFCLAVQRLSD